MGYFFFTGSQFVFTEDDLPLILLQIRISVHPPASDIADHLLYKRNGKFNLLPSGKRNIHIPQHLPIQIQRSAHAVPGCKCGIAMLLPLHNADTLHFHRKRNGVESGVLSGQTGPDDNAGNAHLCLNLR
ncbi:hypothetical protein D3C81_1596630 [compost metagenome]